VPISLNFSKTLKKRRKRKKKKKTKRRMRKKQKRKHKRKDSSVALYNKLHNINFCLMSIQAIC